jgi:hypothetical protein
MILPLNFANYTRNDFTKFYSSNHRTGPLLSAVSSIQEWFVIKRVGKTNELLQILRFKSHGPADQ